MPLFRSLARLARSPQGRQAVNRAVTYARSEEGRKQIAAARERGKAALAAARKPRPR
jgi:hypothetical protein